MPVSCDPGELVIWSGGALVCLSTEFFAVPMPPILRTLDSSGWVGEYTSLAIGADDLPIISYFDDSSDDLNVAHCNDSTCSSATVATVDSAGDVGFHTSIAIGTDGLPVISYFDDTNDDLKVAHCNDVACSTPATLTAVDSTLLQEVGKYTSIAIGDDGFPVISYYNSWPYHDLKVAHCNDPACSTPATVTTVDSAARVGEHTSIAIGTDGLPVISYHDGHPNFDLKTAHCNDAACSTPATLTTVDSAGWVGRYTSIAIGADDLPVISYHDNTNGDLKVARCHDAACASAKLTTVDSAGWVGIYTSVAIGAHGGPVISYYDNTNGDLKAAILPY